LMIIQSLCLRRGFAFRFPLVLLGIGLVTLPFINFDRGEMEMARVEIAVQGALTHPAGFAEWFGFLAIFFTVVGVESRRATWRIAARLLALGCLFIVTLSIERGPLFACALAVTVACRRILNRGFMPTMALATLACVVYSGGVFNQAYENYSTRGLEDTGRPELWETTIDRIWQSPFFGVGESRVLIPLGKKMVPPHNSFLHFAISSGMVPTLFFLAFWIQATWKSIFHEEHSENQPFRLPYLVYALTGLMLGDVGFMSYGGLLITSLAAGAVITHDETRSPTIAPARARPLVQVRRSRSRPVTQTARSRF